MSCGARASASEASFRFSSFAETSSAHREPSNEHGMRTPDRRSAPPHLSPPSPPSDTAGGGFFRFGSFGFGGGGGKKHEPSSEAVPCGAPPVARQRTAFKVRALYAAGGGMADALISYSNMGKPLAAMEACTRALGPLGCEHAKGLRVITQKLSICVGVGRISEAEMAEALGERPTDVCAAFCTTASRVRRAREQRQAYVAFLEPSSPRSPQAASPAPAPALVGTSSRLNCVTDPKDPQHSALCDAMRRLGDAVAALLAPHLSAQSISELHRFVDFWCRHEHLEAFFTSEQIVAEREQLLHEMAAASDG